MMERPAIVKSPFTGGAVQEHFAEEERTFRKESFKVHVSYYICADTGKRFTTEEQERRTERELMSCYRVRHGIPFPDEIASVRKRHGLNYAQITKILGFGVNQYAQYENGLLPSESNGKMIAALRNQTLMLELLENSRGLFSVKEYEKLREHILQAKQQSAVAEKELYLFYRDTQRTIYNGFAACDPLHLEAVVCYLVQQSNEISPVRLGRLLHLSDTKHYQLYGIGITGLRYRQTPYGPLPEHSETIYDNIKGIERDYRFTGDTEDTILTATTAETALLKPTEQAILNEILQDTASKPTQELITPSTAQVGDRNNFILPYSMPIHTQDG